MTSLPDAVTTRLISLTSHAPGVCLANPNSCPSNTEGKKSQAKLAQRHEADRVAPKAYPSCRLF